MASHGSVVRISRMTALIVLWLSFSVIFGPWTFDGDDGQSTSFFVDYFLYAHLFFVNIVDLYRLLTAADGDRTIPSALALLHCSSGTIWVASLIDGRCLRRAKCGEMKATNGCNCWSWWLPRPWLLMSTVTGCGDRRLFTNGQDDYEKTQDGPSIFFWLELWTLLLLFAYAIYELIVP